MAIASSSSVHADAVLGVGEEDRHDVALVHRLLERGVQRRVVRLLAAEVFLHQVLVHLDDLVEDGGVAALDGVEVAFAVVVEQAFDDGFAAAGRAG